MDKDSKTYWLLHESQKLDPLLYIFVYITFISGAAFIVEALQRSDHSLTMFMVAVENIGHTGAFIWGSIAVLTSIGLLLSTVMRIGLIANAIAFTGYSLWFYMGLTFGAAGYWDGIATAVIPNVLFWIWYDIRINWLHHISNSVHLHARH